MKQSKWDIPREIQYDIKQIWVYYRRGGYTYVAIGLLLAMILCLAFGCGHQQTLDELQTSYNRCTLAGDIGCESLKKELDNRLLSVERRKAKECNICPRGMIDWHEGYGRLGRSAHKGCVRRGDLQRSLGGLF